MEGNKDGDDSRISIPDLPEKQSDEVGGVLSLDRSGNPIERTNGSDGPSPDSGESSDASERFPPRSESGKEALIGSEVTHEVLEMLVSSSGPIPNPRDLYSYTPEHQERILRMAEAPRTDESERRSMLASVQKTVIKRSQWIQAIIFGACIVATAVSLWIFHEALGVVFLGPPVIQGIGTVVKSFQRSGE